VPNEIVVEGALQTVDQLRGERALNFIYENEQISCALSLQRGAVR
jgi:hypothetical protein